MEDPKRQAWAYLIAGVLAIIAAIYFISTANQGNDSFGMLDYAILGMGVIAIYRGVKGFLALGRGDAGSGGDAGPKRISRPGERRQDGSGKGGKPEDS